MVTNLALLSQNGVTSVASDTLITLFIALVAIACIVFCIVYLCKYAGEGSIKHKKSAVAVILGIGFIVRLVFSLTIRGYREDYAVFLRAFDHLESSGLDGYYTGDTSTVLYPTVYFVYLIFGGISNSCGLSDFALGAQFMIKLPLIIADLLAAFAVYKIARNFFNERIAFVLMAFVCVCPIFSVASAIWTSPVVFTAMFACFCLYFIVRKKCALAILFATLAAFSGKEGIYLFPAVTVFCVYQFVRAVLNIRRDGSKGGIFSPDKRAVLTVPCGFVLSVAGIYLIGLFMIASYSYNIFTYIYEFTLAPLAEWEYFTYNGLSVYMLFGQNGNAPGARFPSGLFAGLFSVIITVVVCVVYFSKRNRATMLLLGAYSLFTMQVYFPGSSAVGFVMALTPLLMSYAVTGDKRFTYVLFVTGLCYLVNALGVLASAGYLNSFADYVFTDASYTGSTLMSGGLSALSITCSAITVVAHIYYTVITVNVGMTGNRRLLNERSGFVASMREYFSMKKAV